MLKPSLFAKPLRTLDLQLSFAPKPGIPLQVKRTQIRSQVCISPGEMPNLACPAADQGWPMTRPSQDQFLLCLRQSGKGDLGRRAGVQAGGDEAVEHVVIQMLPPWREGTARLVAKQACIHLLNRFRHCLHGWRRHAPCGYQQHSRERWHANSAW